MFSLRKDLPVLTDCGYFSGGALERDMGFFKFFKVFFLMQCLRSLLCNCFLVFPWHKPIPLSYQIVCYMTTPNEEHEECWMYIGDVIIRGVISFFSFFLIGEGLFKVGTFSIFVVLNSHILCMQSRQNDLQTNSDF